MGILAGFMVPHPPLIIPDIGRGQEWEIQDTINAYRKAAEEIGRLRPETIVLLSPHQTMYADYFHISPGRSAKGDFGQFGALHVRMEASCDTAFVEGPKAYGPALWASGSGNWTTAPWFLCIS